MRTLIRARISKSLPLKIIGNMMKLVGKIRILIAVLALAAGTSLTSAGQKQRYVMPSTGNFMRYKVIDGDTVYVASISPSYSFAKGREWRNYTKLVHNFSKTYPYAIEARRMVEVVDSTIETDGLKRKSREKYINTIQNGILEQYEPVIRTMTVSQGKLLIILIGRETGMTPYDIIHDYKNGAAAGFWQGIAKFFGGDLKRVYDGDGKDKATEELVRKWQNGQFPEFYYSIFGQYPKIPVIDHSGEKVKGKAAKKDKKKKTGGRA